MLGDSEGQEGGEIKGQIRLVAPGDYMKKVQMKPCKPVEDFQWKWWTVEGFFLVL